jgi:redox-sensitive bicupin YhaK (pirin superfamily)
MITLRPADERGHANHGWLDTHHTFSFNTYYDPRHMGFRALRVINEDHIAPGRGFGTHGHSDMEILTYVVAGQLAHKDSMGTSAVIRPGEVQRMTAGTGVSHSEFNPSQTEPTHLLQIWLLPERKGLKPGYEQRDYPEAERRGKLRLVASRDGSNGSVTIHQDVRLYDALLAAGDEVTYRLDRDRHAWIQVVKGTVNVNDTPLATSDGAAISLETSLNIKASEEAEILLFDLA